MEETTILEEETPTQSEESEVTTTEDEKTTYTAEEVKAMLKEKESNTEKGVQKLIREKKEAEQEKKEAEDFFNTTLSEIDKVASNKVRLIELYDENPKVAKIILEKYYDWQSIDEFKTSIWYEEDITDPRIIQKQIEEGARKLSEAKEVAREKKIFIEKLQMTPEETEKFEEAFAERMELKSFRVSDIEKHLEKAYREISDNTESLKAMKSQETIAKNMATWDGKGWNDTVRKPNSAIQELLRNHWVIN